jgi:uncharacterized protein YjeT (DUF2065 family)
LLSTLLLGLGVAIALEGAVYALAPEAMRRFLAQLNETTNDQLRIAGLVAVVFGVGLVAFLLR